MARIRDLNQLLEYVEPQFALIIQNLWLRDSSDPILNLLEKLLRELSARQESAMRAYRLIAHWRKGDPDNMYAAQLERALEEPT